MTRRVPELSLQQYRTGNAAARAAFEQALFAGLQDYGFIILADHGVEESLLDAAYATAESFFRRPLEEKLACRGGLRGYTPFGVEHAKDHAVPDLKEFFQVGREPSLGAAVGEDYPPNVWPVAHPEVATVFGRLFAALDEAAQMLLRALAPSLQLPTDWFDERVTAGNSVLRVIHYPPVGADAEPGAVRSAAHEDINLLTLLVAARGGGLQLLDRDGSWLPVETVPRNLIVDSGDMMARLTNGVIPATTHRVINPHQGHAGRGEASIASTGIANTGIANTSRYSIPFFVHPTNATSLAALPSCVSPERPSRYPPVTAGEYLEQRLREIGLAPT